MHIHELLTLDSVRVGLEGSDKESVIDAVVDLLAGKDLVLDLEEVRRVVKQREEVMSTGVGKGLALPHGKTSAVSDNVAALALTKAAVDFSAIDDQPVRLVFLLVGTPESKSQHVKILSRISRLMNRDEVRERMLAARTDRDLYSAVVEAEAALLDQ